MQTIIIPDIHNKTYIADMIANQHQDADIICLGDYFDNFNDNGSDAFRVATWLKPKLHDLRWTLLAGNHDVHYMHSGKFKCSGYSKLKDLQINTVLDKRDWSRLRPYIFTNHYIISHAGFDKRLIHTSIDQTFKQATHELENGTTGGLLEAGKDRGGRAEVGGFTWADFRTIQPLSLPQIVGHTQGERVRFKDNMVCLDTNLNHYGVLDDNGILSIRRA